MKLTLLTILAMLMPSNLVRAMPNLDHPHVLNYQFTDNQKIALWATDNYTIADNAEYEDFTNFFDFNIELTAFKITEFPLQVENEFVNEENISTNAQDLLPIKPTNSDPIAQSSATQLETEETKLSAETNATEENKHNDLAKLSQNPVANLISVPFQNNTNFGVGKFDRTNNILNIQPVIPTVLNEDWLFVSRPIIPVAYQPELAPNFGNNFGLGDIVYQGYITPNKPSKLILAAGPVLLFPTATAKSLGTGKWGAGAGAVGLLSEGPIVTGVLVNNVWSFAGDSDRSDVSLMTINPFFNYNFKGGWYFSTSPNLLANWFAEGEKWLIPIGGGFGRVFSIGKQPVNMSLRFYWNAVKPEDAADWTVQYTMTLLFPR